MLIFIFFSCRNILLGKKNHVYIADLGYGTVWEKNKITNTPCGSLYYASPGECLLLSRGSPSLSNNSQHQQKSLDTMVFMLDQRWMCGPWAVYSM